MIAAVEPLVLPLHASGHTTVEIAIQLGLGLNVVRQVLRKRPKALTLRDRVCALLRHDPSLIEHEIAKKLGEQPDRVRAYIADWRLNGTARARCVHCGFYFEERNPKTWQGWCQWCVLTYGGSGLPVEWYERSCPQVWLDNAIAKCEERYGGQVHW